MSPIKDLGYNKNRLLRVIKKESPSLMQKLYERENEFEMQSTKKELM